jgi:hypothetical protein
MIVVNRFNNIAIGANLAMLYWNRGTFQWVTIRRTKMGSLFRFGLWLVRFVNPRAATRRFPRTVRFVEPPAAAWRFPWAVRFVKMRATAWYFPQTVRFVKCQLPLPMPIGFGF